MARAYFCAYHSYLKAMQSLTDEECGRLFRALLIYSEESAAAQLPGPERYIFDALADQIDRDRIKYRQVCEKNRENAKKRGASRTAAEQVFENGVTPHGSEPVFDGESKTEDGVFAEEMSDKSDRSDNFDASEIGSGVFDGQSPFFASACVRSQEEGKEEEERKEKEKGEGESVFGCAAAESFNRICKSLPGVKFVSDKRKKALLAAKKQLDRLNMSFEELFEKAEASDYLSGRNGKWTNCGFEWIISPQNIVKIAEGTYDNRPGTHESDGGGSFDTGDFFEKALARSQMLMKGEKT